MSILSVPRTLLLACVASQLIAATGLARESAIIEGHVFNKLNGVPLEFASIEILGISHVWPTQPTTLGRAHTDANGFYSFEVHDTDFDFDLYIIVAECRQRVKKDGTTRTVNGQSQLQSLRAGVMRRDLYLTVSRYPRRIQCNGLTPLPKPRR